MRDSKNSHFSSGIPHENPNSLYVEPFGGAIEVNPVEMIGVIRARRVALRQGGEK